jgi:hypothetical protein
MTVDEGLIKKAEAAGAHLAEADRAAAIARAEYNTVIRRMHLAGASLREIATALGVSHQRVQQIVDDAGGSWWQRRTRDTVCTFCGRPPSEVSKLISGPNVFICDSCVGLAEEALSRGASGKTGGVLAVAKGGRATCSFCGERRSQERALVIGPSSNACGACLKLCRQILDDTNV